MASIISSSSPPFANVASSATPGQPHPTRAGDNFPQNDWAPSSSNDAKSAEPFAHAAKPAPDGSERLQPKSTFQPWNPSGSKTGEDEILALQAQMKAKQKQRLPNFAKYSGPLELAPEGVKPELKAGYQKIIDFMKNPDALFGRLQQIEAEVGKRVASKHETKENALEAILAAGERKHGFGKVIEIKTLTREVIANGTLFKDMKYPAGSNHGQQIHRIQWNLILREIDGDPAGFSNIRAVEYYKEFASLDIETFGIKWYAPWNELFDNHTDMANAPERYRKDGSSFLPILKGWE